MLICCSRVSFLAAQSNMMHKACPYEITAQYHLVIVDWTVKVIVHCVSSMELQIIHLLHVFIFFFSLIILCGHLLFLNIVGIYFFMFHIIESNAV